MTRIGIFDSGLGGLSVLVHATRLLPERAFAYVADQARAPYGDLPVELVRSHAHEIVQGLIDDGSDVVVVACNTASEAALDDLRARHPEVAVVGMEPAVKPAVELTRTGTIGVLATSGTIAGRRLSSVIERFATGRRVLAQACPGLVELVEDGLADSHEARRMLSEYVHPLVADGADTLVLGCTHYTFLADSLRAVVGDDIAIVDPAEAVAAQIRRVAGPVVHDPGPTRFETTGDPVRMRRQLNEILGIDAPVHSPAWMDRR